MFVELPTSALTLVGTNGLVEGVDEHHRARLIPYTESALLGARSCLDAICHNITGSRLSFLAGSRYVGALATLSVTDGIAIY